MHESSDRWLLLPVTDDRAWEFYKAAVANFWTVEEVDLANDRFDQLDENDRHSLKLVLAFFAAADGIVGENLALNFIPQVQRAEIRAFYTFQMAIETVHAEMYGKLIETYMPTAEERTETFQAINNIPAVKRLGDWAVRWTDADKASFGARLVAFACVEGIMFAGPFCVIFHFKTRGILPGLCKSNEWIARDETQHMEFACFLYRERLLPAQRIADAEVHAIVSECVEAQKAFVREAVRDMPGLSTATMLQYIEFVADVLLGLLGVPTLYGTSNPYSWMDMIGMPAKTNFFEGRVSEYQRGADKTICDADMHSHDF